MPRRRTTTVNADASARYRREDRGETHQRFALFEKFLELVAGAAAAAAEPGFFFRSRRRVLRGDGDGLALAPPPRA